MAVKAKAPTMAQRIENVEATVQDVLKILNNGIGDRIAKAVAEAVSKNNIEVLVEFMSKQKTDKPTRKQITVQKLLEVMATAAVLGLVMGAVVLLLIGKMTADDVANIIKAVRGGG